MAESCGGQSILIKFIDLLLAYRDLFVETLQRFDLASFSLKIAAKLVWPARHANCCDPTKGENSSNQQRSRPTHYRPAIANLHLRRGFAESRALVRSSLAHGLHAGTYNALMLNWTVSPAVCPCPARPLCHQSGSAESAASFPSCVPVPARGRAILPPPSA